MTETRADIELVKELAMTRDEADRTLVEAVRIARRANSWDAIASALGITRQGAMRRYAHKVDHVDLRRSKIAEAHE